ncbi:hypothetical protein V492_08140 [Pseudogymnoascus sp. VKM F-4246]|nr:hypothetical protein V492_08140 [Pseudogymnoascus sp. VKM F-4246]
MEAVIHLPVSFWAIKALLGDGGRVPLVLFAYALQTVITTATCMYDFSQWEGVAPEAKWHLASLYGPYLLIGTFYPFPDFWVDDWAWAMWGGGYEGGVETNGHSYVHGGRYVGEAGCGFEGAEGSEGSEEGKLEAVVMVAKGVGIYRDLWGMLHLV